MKDWLSAVVAGRERRCVRLGWVDDRRRPFALWSCSLESCSSAVDCDCDWRNSLNGTTRTTSESTISTLKTMRTRMRMMTTKCERTTMYWRCCWSSVGAGATEIVDDDGENDAEIDGRTICTCCYCRHHRRMRTDRRRTGRHCRWLSDDRAIRNATMMNELKRGNERCRDVGRKRQPVIMHAFSYNLRLTLERVNLSKLLFETQM